MRVDPSVRLFVPPSANDMEARIRDALDSRTKRSIVVNFGEPFEQRHDETMPLPFSATVHAALRTRHPSLEVGAPLLATCSRSSVVVERHDDDTTVGATITEAMAKPRPAPRTGLRSNNTLTTRHRVHRREVKAPSSRR